MLINNLNLQKSLKLGTNVSKYKEQDIKMYY